MLITLAVLTLVVVSVGPFSDSQSPWQTESELTSERLVVRYDQFAIAVHLASGPVALILLAVGPSFDAVAMGNTFGDLTDVTSKLGILIQYLGVLADELLLGLQIFLHDPNRSPVILYASQLRITGVIQGDVFARSVLRP